MTTTGHQLSDHFGADVKASRRFLEGADAFFGQADIPFHDLLPATVAATDGDFGPITIPGDGHPNEAGARLIAELAWEALRDVLRGLQEHR